MDCCNYVQPYPGHGNFYQHQQFCYDNINDYTPAPISDSIEANHRYTRLQTAYPTDYVYNPKEARLRKAMREQSRELSRQSILQTTVGSANDNITGGGSNNSSNNSNNNITTTNNNNNNNNNNGNGSTNYLNHHQMSCSPASPSMPSLTGNYNTARMINPWFQIGSPVSPHMKPMLSHRVMQAHQRTFDKTKEVLRKQAECAGAFSAASATACYPGDFTIHGAPTQSPTDTSTTSSLESNDYCSIGEFSDGQKWHPYQSSPGTYHPRGGSITKMTGRHTMQNINPHGHAPWNQFCSVPLFSMAPQNPMMRTPRHMVFMQDQQERHCNFPEEMRMPYMNNKMEIGHRIHRGYHTPPLNYQQAESEKCKESQKWENPETAVNSLNNSQQRESESHSKDHQSNGSEDSKDFGSDEVESHHQQPKQQQKSVPSKQPLPGFHQAFGSTEIGRFSRSEFFANMVGENNGVSRNHSNITPTENKSPSTSTTTTSINHQLDNVNGTSCSDSEDMASSLVDTSDNHLSNLSSNTYSEDVRSKIRWHSPYVSAIGSEN